MSKGFKVFKLTFMRAPPNPALNIARIPSLSPSSLAALHLKVYIKTLGVVLPEENKIYFFTYEPNLSI